jgi:hypothetical protein
VARFDSNANIPIQVVTELRRMGHDVVTSQEAGKANSAVPDLEVLEFADGGEEDSPNSQPASFSPPPSTKHMPLTGIVLCTVAPNFSALAQRIHDAIQTGAEISNCLFRVNWPG